MTALLHAFQCEGTLGIVQANSVFRFAVYRDGSVVIKIKPSNVIESESEDPVETAGLEEEVGERQQLEDEPAAQLAQECVAFDALASTTCVTRNGEVLLPIQFRVAQYQHPQARVTALIACHLQVFFAATAFDEAQASTNGRGNVDLLPSRVCGKWVNMDVNAMDDASGSFELQVVQTDHATNFESHQQLERHRVFPLTPGKYELKGVAIAENGLAYGCHLFLHLLPNGKVDGYSQEAYVKRTCPILKGEWAREELQYTLEYRTNNLVSQYEYFGSALSGLLRGAWRNCNPYASLVSRSEKGIFELELARSSRPWTQLVHGDFPVVFRDTVKAVLEDVETALPNEIWCKIFEYCEANWFREQDQLQ